MMRLDCLDTRARHGEDYVRSHGEKAIGCRVGLEWDFSTGLAGPARIMKRG